jgi:O-antigen/teichoic acid export membrane protein
MNIGNLAEQKKYTKSKRIASNTIILFVRMFILMLVNLYAVRIVLKGLGETDYGIFNAVGGVVTVTGFISSVFALSIQRFYSVALGEHNVNKLNDIFSVSINIVLVTSFIVLVLFESVGLWFLNTQMTIPLERIGAADWLFQFSLFIFIFSLVQIPYTAAVFAHEDMGLYAFISTIECLGRLFIAYLISRATIDKLSFYGAGLLLVAIIVLISYVLISRNRYSECHYHKSGNRNLYKQLLTFSGWTTFGSIANTCMVQGSIILINIYFGPIINVAFGIALNINNAFAALTNSMIIPFRPAMIRAYAERKFEYVSQLFYVSNKFIVYALLIVAIPTVVEIENVLKLWLGYVNKDTLLFSQLMIIYVFCLALHNPITIIMHASGHIKEYHLPVESITLLCLPITWLLFYFKYPSYCIFFVMIGICIVAHIIRLYCLHHFYSSFSILQYLKSVLFPAILIAIVGLSIIYIIHVVINNVLIRITTESIISPLSIILMTYLFGTSKKEKEICKTFVYSIIKYRTCHI